ERQIAGDETLDLEEVGGDLADGERAHVVAGDLGEDSGPRPSGIVAQVEGDGRPQRAEDHLPGGKAEETTIDAREHVVDRLVALREDLIAHLVGDAGRERAPAGEIDRRLPGVLGERVVRPHVALVDEVDAAAQGVGERVQARRADAEVDDPFERIRRWNEAVGALRGRGGTGGTFADGVAEEREVRLGGGGEGESPAPEIALRPLRRRARAVLEGEAHRRLEVLGGPLAELYLDRLLRLGNLGIARRERSAEEEPGAQERLLSAVDHFRSEDVAGIERDQVADERLLRPALPDHLDETHLDDGPGLDAVADLDLREFLARLGILLEDFVVFDASVEMAAAGEDLREGGATLLGGEIAERPPRLERDGGVDLGIGHLHAAFHRDARDEGPLAFGDGNGDGQAVIVAGDGLRTRRPGPYGKVSLALVEVLDLLQRASVEDRLEDRLRIDADARLVEGGGCAGDADAIGVRGIGTARRVGIDAVAELLEKALAQLRGADVLVSAEAHLLDPDLPALVHREDDRRRAVATGKLALGDAGTQETLRDVEAPQAGRHLLRRLRIEGLVLAGGSELLHEERIGILPVAADVEAHHRTGIDRDHDAGARLALFLHHGRADAGA